MSQTLGSPLSAFGEAYYAAKVTLCRRNRLVAHTSQRALGSFFTLLVVSQSKVRRVKAPLFCGAV